MEDQEFKPKLSGVLPTGVPCGKEEPGGTGPPAGSGGQIGASWLGAHGTNPSLRNSSWAGPPACPGAGFPLSFRFLYKSVHVGVSGAKAGGQHVAQALSLNQ